MSGEFSLWTEDGYDMEEKVVRAYDLVDLKYLQRSTEERSTEEWQGVMLFLCHFFFMYYKD